MSFPARYPGYCFGSGDMILPGQEVEYTEEGTLAHVECTEAADPAQPASHEEKCTTCFMIHPKGACDA